MAELKKIEKNEKKRRKKNSWVDVEKKMMKIIKKDKKRNVGKSGKIGKKKKYVVQPRIKRPAPCTLHLSSLFSPTFSQLSDFNLLFHSFSLLSPYSHFNLE